MLEFLLGVKGIVALLFVVAACFFYMWGGRDPLQPWMGKWLRRFIGSLVLATGANVIALWIACWRWEMLLVYPALCAGFSMGYGGDDFMEKLLRRTVYAAGVVGAGFVMVWAAGWSGNAITVLIVQSICGVGSIVLGIKNPLPAAIEEVMVCIVLTLFIPIYPFTMLVGGS